MEEDDLVQVIMQFPLYIYTNMYHYFIAMFMRKSTAATTTTSTTSNTFCCSCHLLTLVDVDVVATVTDEYGFSSGVVVIASTTRFTGACPVSGRRTQHTTPSAT